MAGFLRLYLVVTGALGTLAVMVPGLVVLGLFLLILPGLILGLAPTAFLWGAIFTAAWWPLQRLVGSRFGAVLAAAATAGVVVGVPVVANAPIQVRSLALRAGDKDASGPIPLGGHVRFQRTSWRPAQMDDPDWARQVEAFRAERRSPDWSRRPVACDALCAATLFSPGVQAVTVEPIARPQSGDRVSDQPATFYLERTPGCAGSLNADDSGSGEGFKNLAALQDAWRIRISEGQCIRRARTVTAGHDYQVTLAQWTDGPDRAKPWSLVRQPIQVLRLEIRDGRGELLQRRTRVKGALLDRLLWAEGSGDLQSFHFGWGRRSPPEGREPGAFVPVELLAKLTPLQLSVEPVAVAEAARAQLRASLADAGRSPDDPAFGLPKRVFDDIRENGLRPGDAELTEQVIADVRTRELGGIWGPIDKLGPDAQRLREPIVKRLLAQPYPDRTDSGVAQLGRALASLPPGAFSQPTADELRLLGDPQRRSWATGLIMRQADRGGEAAPLLTRILAEGVAPYPDDDERREPGRRAAEAARVGLCRLGPEAAGALGEIDRLVAAGHLRQSQLDDREWQLTLARLGRPVESFRSPPNHSWSDAQLHNWLRRRLKDFKPDQDCR